jgi:CelD/BcsL family acetyltransferase involved in cellulose biosynthesis
MTRPIPPTAFAAAVPVAMTARLVDGLPAVLDDVAADAPETHRHLRRQWFAAALATYGGAARTIVVAADGADVLALPLVAAGPRWLRLASVPGCYWPFRSFPASVAAGDGAFAAALDALAGAARGLRLGPIYDGDAGAAPLLAAARARGWAVLDRFVADSFLLDIDAERAAGPWPRNTTLRKNRFHEKHLAAHGEPGWHFLAGADWPAAFDRLAAVEAKSWIAADTDGRDAKFTREGHGAFWRAAAADPVLADAMQAALLTIDGVPAAFSFDLDAGATRYAIANSYDPAFAKHSPGKLLYWRNLARAAERGTRRVDWGAGDSGYKRVIGAARGPAIRDWLLLRPGVPAALGRLLAAAWRRSGNPPAAGA